MDNTQQRSVFFEVLRAAAKPVAFFKGRVESRFTIWQLAFLSFVVGFIYAPPQICAIFYKQWIYNTKGYGYYLWVAIAGGVLMTTQFLLGTLTFFALTFLKGSKEKKLLDFANISFYLAVSLWTVSIVFSFLDYLTPLTPVALPGILSGATNFYFRPSHLFAFSWIIAALFCVFRYQLTLPALPSFTMALAFPFVGRFAIEQPNFLWNALIKPLRGGREPKEQVEVYLFSHGLLLVTLCIALIGLQKFSKNESITRKKKAKAR